MANNTEQLREKLSIILDAYKRYVRDDGPRPFAKLQTKLTKKLTLDEIHALIEAEATRREQAAFLTGYEAGQSIEAGTAKSISWAEAKKIIKLKRQAEGGK